MAKTLHQQLTYSSWTAMKYRCRPNFVSARYYYERGIGVCDRWLVYENFVADMGLRKSKKYTLDRINNDEGYKPGNCRWATWKQQSRNRRPYNGKPKTLKPVEVARNALLAEVVLYRDGATDGQFWVSKKNAQIRIPDGDIIKLIHKKEAYVSCWKDAPKHACWWEGPEAMKVRLRPETRKNLRKALR